MNSWPLPITTDFRNLAFMPAQNDLKSGSHLGSLALAGLELPSYTSKQKD